MNTDQDRRSLLKKMVYVPPAVLTLSAMPFSASYGSGAKPPKQVKPKLSTKKIGMRGKNGSPRKNRYSAL